MYYDFATTCPTTRTGSPAEYPTADRSTAIACQPGKIRPTLRPVETAELPAVARQRHDQRSLAPPDRMPGGGWSKNIRAGNPASAASAPITGRRSRVRLLIWNSSVPPGASFRRYSASASRVSRCIGMLSELKASSDQHIVRHRPARPRWSAAHRPGQHAVDCRNSQELEVARIARNTFDQRIDLVECPVLPGLGIAGKRAGPQPDHRDR